MGRSVQARSVVALVGVVFSCGAVLPTPASAATRTDTVTAKTENGSDCRNWGLAAVRNWLSDRCPGPTGSPTYKAYLSGGGGVWIRGVTNGDGCTYSPDTPLQKFHFRPACDMHDYGVWLMEHGRLKKSQMNLNEINSWFDTVLRYGVCGAYRGSDRATCRQIAKGYGCGVQLFAGSPVAPV